MDMRRLTGFVFAVSVMSSPVDAEENRAASAEEVRAAVDAGLGWLARNQAEAGNWEVKRWEGQMGEEATVGVTGLALLAFLRAGHTEKSGPYKETVAKAVKYLVGRQTGNGCIGDNSSTRSGGGYNHAMAALALAEAYGASGDRRIGKAARKAVIYSIGTHQGTDGGWRYLPGMNGDTSVTGWYVTQLKRAIVARLKVEPKGFQGAVGFLAKVVDMRTGRAAYIPGSDPTPSMTAVAMHCLQCMGWQRNSRALVGGADFLLEHLPDRNAGGTNDFYYWYYGTLAMSRMAGKWQNTWRASLHGALIPHQHHTPNTPKLDGSWDPIGMTGKAGGRACVTALGCLTLEISRSRKDD